MDRGGEPPERVLDRRAGRDRRGAGDRRNDRDAAVLQVERAAVLALGLDDEVAHEPRRRFVTERDLREQA